MSPRQMLPVVVVALALSPMGCQDRPPAPGEAAAEELVGLIKDRLQIMPELVRAKRILNLPIEDTSREEAILQAAEVDARAYGLDPAFVRRFFRAQFDAAKMVQESSRREVLPKANDDAMKAAGTRIEECRTRINDINGKMIKAMSKLKLHEQADDFRTKLRERGEEALAEFDEQIRSTALKPLSNE